MIDEFDEALRQLLMDELDIRNGEIDIQFKAPNREWSSRLGRPTLNIFLYDLRENVKLRQHSPQYAELGRGGGFVTQQLMPLQLNLYYLITAWANEPEDEHRMLSRALIALYRHPYLDDNFRIGDLRDQPGRIEILAAQPTMLTDASLFWSALDNEIRPAVVCQVTLALDPYTPFSTPIVSARGVRFEDEPTGSQEGWGREFWAVQGRLRGVTPMRRVRAVLVEEDMTINVRHDGTFVIQGLLAGDYTLEVTLENQPPVRHTLTVPSREYVFDV
jgi:hypothetical protein